MVDRVWIGGGNNNADNPKDWSPTGVPQFNDNLSISSGRINIVNSDLPLVDPDPLEVYGNSTINLTNDPVLPGIIVFAGKATINVHGNNTFALETVSGLGGSAIVNLAANSNWIGDFSQFGGSLVVNGGNHATFINSKNLSGATGVGVHVTFNANIAAGGAPIYALYGATIEVGGAVAAGAAIAVVGDAATPGHLQIDHPTAFLGQAQLGIGEIDLIGLAKANSYNFKNDLLSIYSAKGLIDTLSLQQGSDFQAASPFAVEKTAVGLSIYATADTSHSAGTLLPLHT